MAGGLVYAQSEQTEQALLWFKLGVKYYDHADYLQAQKTLRRAIDIINKDQQLLSHHKNVVESKTIGRRVIKTNREIPVYIDYKPNHYLALIRTTLLKRRHALSPPSLHLAFVAIREPSHNQVLDGGESGFITLRIDNKGKTLASNVNLRIQTSPLPGLIINKDVSIGDIDAVHSLVVEIPVRADVGIQASKVLLTVIAREEFGFDSEKLNIHFYTARHKPPKLVLGSVDVEDFDNDRKIEADEVIKLSTSITNAGQGMALGVSAQLALAKTSSPCPKRPQARSFSMI